MGGFAGGAAHKRIGGGNAGAEIGHKRGGNLFALERGGILGQGRGAGDLLGERELIDEGLVDQRTGAGGSGRRRREHRGGIGGWHFSHRRAG